MHSKADIITIKAVHDALEELADHVVFLGAQQYRYMPNGKHLNSDQPMTWTF